jgi:cell fate (sporulation/competence/biofilm development) regulator YlbF (YheA/YmcA/DUF963 family)
MSLAHVGVDDVVVQAAEALAQALQSTSVWEEHQHALAAVRSNPDLCALLARYRELLGRAQRAKTQGTGLTGPESLELAELQAKIQPHPAMVRQQEAGALLLALLQQTNSVLSTELGMNFAAMAAPSCGSC